MALPQGMTMQQDTWRGQVTAKQPAHFDGVGMLSISGAILREGGPATLYCQRGDKDSFAICRLTQDQPVCQVQLHLEGAPAKLTCSGTGARLLVSGSIRRFGQDEAKIEAVVRETPAKRARVADVSTNSANSVHSPREAPATSSSPAKKPASPALKSQQVPATSSSPAKKAASPALKSQPEPATSSSHAKKAASPALKSQPEPATSSSPAKKSASPALKSQPDPLTKDRSQSYQTPRMQGQQLPQQYPAPVVEETAKKSKKAEAAPLCVRKLPSGLEFEVLVPGGGDGRMANLGKSVDVRIVGRIAGREAPFESGTQRFRLGMGDTIRGLDEGIKGMMQGEKRRLHVPSRLAYGLEGNSPNIPPNSNLVFEVELLRS